MKKTLAVAMGTVWTSAAMLCAAVPSNGNPDDRSEDDVFFYLLQNDGVLYAPGLQKTQGQRICDAIMAGQRPRDALFDLMRSGGYSYDVANAISSAAEVAYCPCTSTIEGNRYLPPNVPPMPMLLDCSDYEMSRR